tara:strand:+ start:411 stop:1298 length:888 start_codon:yes stop_codon:yes gene_type:complete
MAKDNKGNVAEATPEVDLSQHEDAPGTSNDEASAFFSALDESVNGAFIDNGAEADNRSSSDNTQQEQRPEEAQIDHQAEAENLSKRYADSSREAKRLNNRLGELEPYVPILDAMRQDPNLVSHVKGYFEGGGSAPESMKERLGLDEDFVFDPDEAFSNPKSESSQLMGATIDGIVQRRLAQANRKMQQDNQRLSEERSFKQRHNMSEDEWNDFQRFAKGRSLKLDDIYYLMNREGREQKIAENTGRQVQEQIRNVQNRPASVATTGNVDVQEKSQDDQVFDALLGVDENFNSLTG